MKQKNSVECFNLFQTMLKYTNMKSYKNIVCKYFVNVNVALNSRAYKEN